METFKTKGIVLRTVKYGETSIITTIFTELFGVQSYIVKGVRQSSKRSAGNIFFQTAAMLQMVVYHNELKKLNFIKEYQWAYLYNHVLFDVVKNAVAMYMVEMLQHVLKQPEANPELYYLAENTLQHLDEGDAAITANLPLHFMLQLGRQLGFWIQGSYTADTPVVDLNEGYFTGDIPNHPYYLEGALAQVTSAILHLKTGNQLADVKLNRQSRRQLLVAYQQYIALHVQDFGELKSLPVLQEVLG